jgi:hypothetical protein
MRSLDAYGFTTSPQTKNAQSNQFNSTYGFVERAKLSLFKIKSLFCFVVFHLSLFEGVSAE